MTDFDAIKAQQQRMWATGDFAMIAWNTAFPCDLACEAAGLRAGWKVLDVATGSGNAALSAARRGARATGIDYVPALIERARERAAAEHLPADFAVGDCESLAFADESFDAVISVFGSMFAPDQERAARELVRVCRRGGRIVLANWTPESFWGQAFGLISRYRPPPAGLRSPLEWGTKFRLEQLFGAAVSMSRVKSRRALFRYRNSRHWIEVFGKYFGPVMRTLEVLDETARAQFLGELETILDRFNCSDDRTLVVAAEYLEIVMTRT